MALLSTEDVLNKKFQYVKFREGYDQVEVDEFLDEVVQTIYALQAENQDLKEKLEAAERRIAELSAGGEGLGVAETPKVEAAPAPAAAGLSSPESAASMLALAQRVHDEYVRDGREESNRIIAEARTKGDEIIADAQRQHESILSKLDEERALLETKISELRSFEAEYRTNLRTHLESLIKEVNQGGQA
ncbi:MAG: DivIVA domain-containing protein [Actinomycetaceae bacterium]|nr:DivIVA domain-containing protein [Actinomycetaceae bacterium]